MKQITEPGKLPFLIDRVRLVKSGRDRGFRISYREGRESARFVYCLRGSIRYEFFDGKTPPLTLGHGQLVFFPQSSRHCAEYTEDGSRVCVLLFDLVSGELPGQFSEPFVRSDEVIGSIFHSFSVGKGGDPFSLTAKCYELFGHLCFGERQIPNKYLRLSPALEDLWHSFTVSRKVGEYAAMCGMSEPGFRRLFGEYAGMSPIAYRNSLRLWEARNLIESGEFSIEEIAEMTGFSNISFFYRAYRTQFGAPPRALPVF